MQSPKNFYPPEWFRDSEQKSVPVKEKQKRSAPQYSVRRLASGCLLIQLAPRRILSSQESRLK
jgi:hypothetical protein